MKIVIDDLIEENRLDTFLRDYIKDISRSKLANEIKSGNITVNSKPSKPSYIIKTGDIIDINSESQTIQILPENIPLDIVWENENMAVVNKPSGMLTHPTTIEHTGTLVNALLYKYNNNLSDINGELRRGIVHRLDRNTSGLLMIAKNNKAHEWLAEKIKEKKIEKHYFAIVRGVIEQDEFVINKPIGRNPNQPHKMAIREDGKESVSVIKTLKRFKDATLLDINLITGRTHQIRVHLSSVGHPVFNDTLYGFGKMRVNTEEQVLQSYKLAFPEPFTDNIIELEIPQDEKIKKVLKYLETL